MYQEPSAHRIDPANGEMSGASGRYERRLKDLADLYQDRVALVPALAERGESCVYRVSEKRPEQRIGDLIFGTTCMEPGRIGSEFYMTRGHLHAIANRPEVYCGESGRGLMLLESLDGEVRILDIAPQLVIYVPPFWLHRTINTGNEPLTMRFFYPSDSGQDYTIIDRSGGMAVRILADGAGWKAVANPTYRPRTSDDVARVFAATE